MVVLDEKEKQPVLRIGVFTQNSAQSDHGELRFNGNFKKGCRVQTKMPPRNSAMT
jgi:hypothetical protein